MKKKSKLNKKIFIPVSRPIVTKNDAKKIYKVVKSGWVSSSGLKINEFEKKLAKFNSLKCHFTKSGTFRLFFIKKFKDRFCLLIHNKGLRSAGLMLLELQFHL